MAIGDPVLFAIALANEACQMIMKLCCCKWISVGNIVEQLSVTQPTGGGFSNNGKIC